MTVRVSLPLIPVVSKNRTHRLVRGRIVINPAARKWALLAKALIRKAAAGHQWARDRKVWLGIQVNMLDHRGDAINVLDWVADAVAGAIGVDDRWFALTGLGWSVVHKRPGGASILVDISQEEPRWP